MLCLAAAASSAGAQDLITKVNGEEIWARVLEVNDKNIRYKLWDYPDGPTYTLLKSKILTVRYSNGVEETMRVYPLSDAFLTGRIHEGMKYRDYRKLYNPKDYVHMEGDRYIPAVGGICSWLLPGLGQMVSGEVGRGFAFLGGSLGSLYLAVIGSSLLPAGSHDYPDNVSPGNEVAGTLMTLVGCAGYLTFYIWSITDACKVAKIKNMYRRDVLDMTSVELKLEPYFATTYGMTPSGNVPLAAGASLKICF